MTSDQMIFGINPVREAILGKARPIKVIHTSDRLRNKRLSEIEELARREGIQVIHSGKDLLDRLTGVQKHQGVAAKVGAFRIEHSGNSWRGKGIRRSYS